MHLNTRPIIWALPVFAVLVLGLGRPAQAQSPDAEFRNGVAAFEEGRFEEAERHFREVLKSNPSHEQALRYRDEAGYHFWVKVLARGERLGTVAQRILRSAERGAVRERQDAQQMRTELRNLWSDDFMVQIETTERLIAKHGHYVVPEVVPILADRHEDDKRVRVIALLSRLGDEGTLALIPLLGSGDIVLQQNVAAILGHTRDVRAVPPLMRLAQSTDDVHVREAANQAIARIGGPRFEIAEYYARVADAFYREDPLFLTNRYREYVVWEWKDSRLTYREVPKFRWNEEVAEEYCYAGLEVAPDDQRLWALLLNVYAQQWTEIEEALRVAQQLEDRGGQVDQDHVSTLRDLERGLAKVKMLVASRGAEGILAALGKALADQRAPNAVFLIERLQELNIPPSVLASGGPVAYLPPAERDGRRAAPAPAARPAAPAPSQPAEPAPRPEPVPDRWDDAPREDAPPLDDGGFEEDAPPLDGEPRRRPRRVSEGPGAPRAGELAAREQERVTRMGFRDGRAVPNVLTAVGSLTGPDASGEILTGGAALSAALTYGDKRVRYAAAIALAHLNPSVDFANSDAVMTNLIDALGESGQRVVVVVERDRHDRNRIVGLLRELGTMAFGVESGRDGIVRARSFPGQDLIIVSSELNADRDPGVEPLEFQFIDTIRDDYRTAHIKVMVLTPEERVTAMRSLVDEGKAIDVVTPEIDKATLSDKLDQAFGTPADQRDEKARSDKITERAALAIARLQTGHTRFATASAAPALARNVRRDTGRPDSVRLACLEALSAIGPATRGAALDVLVREFGDRTNSAEVRRALPVAIGEAVKGGELTGEAFQVLMAALAAGDEEIWRAAGYALGKAVLTPQQALEVFKAQRLE